MKYYWMSNSFPLIIIDESTDARITAALQKEGYNVLSVQQLMPGIDDLAIIVEELLNAFAVLDKRKLRIKKMS
ncbi:hypothetical protein SAE01_15950 [Segetibacter aerophilus]|uniref:DUF5615 domain-containing protein n=2 Tax=Segetibacter aerophilus TaxID=670293 RepID=A0A512BAW1_9BACT|nr:hypothetical protein SAE01_15950 [Segetibacter aerophilus]